MKISLTLLALPVMLALGCGGSKKMTMTPPDMTVTDKADMTTIDNCTKIDTWPTNKQGAFLDTTTGYPFIAGVYDIEDNATNPAHHDELLYRYYQGSGPTVQVPHDFDMDPEDDADTFGLCTDCVTAFLDYDPADETTGTFYYATEGSIHVEKLDHKDVTGTISVTGTNLKLVHWDYDPDNKKDVADPDGKCFTVGSFNFTANYDNTPTDGGTDAGN